MNQRHNPENLQPTPPAPSRKRAREPDSDEVLTIEKELTTVKENVKEINEIIEKIKRLENILENGSESIEEIAQLITPAYIQEVRKELEQASEYVRNAYRRIDNFYINILKYDNNNLGNENKKLKKEIDHLNERDEAHNKMLEQKATTYNEISEQLGTVQKDYRELSAYIKQLELQVQQMAVVNQTTPTSPTLFYYNPPTPVEMTSDFSDPSQTIPTTLPPTLPPISSLFLPSPPGAIGDVIESEGYIPTPQQARRFLAD